MQFERSGELVEHQVDIAGEQVVDRRRGALIGHMRQLGAGDGLKQLGGRVRGGANALRGIIDLAGIGFGVGNELGHGLGREILAHQNDVGHVRHDRDRDQLRRIVIQRLVEKRRRCDRRRLRSEQRVAVRLGLEHRFGGEAAAHARFIFDDERLAERGSHFIGDDSGDGVHAAARRH